MSNAMEWTPLHAAARIACGNLEGEASNRLERSVRLAWESMRADGMIGGGVEWDYAQESSPISTYRLWEAFAECSALRIELEEYFPIVDAASFDGCMRGAYRDCVARALVFMPAAIDEVES